MVRVQMLGRIYPIIAAVSVTLPQDISWKWEEKNLDLKFKVRISNSVINVECELERYENSFFEELYKRSYDLVRALVNVVSFQSGIGLTVTLDTHILPDGTPSAILLHHPSLSPLCTAIQLSGVPSPDLERVLLMIILDPTLFLALNDLTEAIRIPHASLINCGRVVDSIRRMITADPKVPVGKGWQAMQGALNISQDYQEFISKQSTGPRHGDRAFVSGAITTEAVRRTWIIMNRYLEYRKRDSGPLKAPEFPLLLQ